MSITILNSWASSWTNIRGHMASAEREPIMGVWCCHMSEMALNCYVYELFMVINGTLILEVDAEDSRQTLTLVASISLQVARSIV